MAPVRGIRYGHGRTQTLAPPYTPIYAHMQHTQQQQKLILRCVLSRDICRTE